MTSLLSSISGVFSKALILGTFLPVIVFITFSMVFLVPLVPSDLAILKRLATLDTQWQVITITFIAILMSGMLYNLNIPLIRMYEGYPWKETWVGRLRTRYYRSQFEADRSRQRGMRTLLRAMGKADPVLIDNALNRLRTLSPNLKSLESKVPRCSLILDQSPDQASIQWQQLYELIKAEWERTSQVLLKRFPGAESLVLPTRLGNVIRSFEYYPQREYGMDGVTLWPRLIAKVDKDYAALVDDSKTSFDFMLNGSALSAALAIFMLLAGLLYAEPFSSYSAAIPWLAQILIFTVLSYILYFQSISRAANWGDMVKGAFDLYRNDLLKLLGFEQKLRTKDAERKLWNKISVQVIYGDSPEGPRTNYGDEIIPDTFARGDPTDVQLQVSRGIDYRIADIAVIVAVVVKNIDKRRLTAKRVVLTETVSPELEYAWGSARLNGVALREVAGVGPYRFSLGDMSPGDELLLTYSAFQRKT